MEVSSVAECIAVDLGILGYYNALRIQGRIGSLAMSIEHELLGAKSPPAKFGKQWGRAEGLRVGVTFRRLSEQMLPLIEKTTKRSIRSLKAVRELKTGPLPNVSINNPCRSTSALSSRTA